MPDFAGALKGEWVSIDTGISGRINNPLVEIDSKGLIWVISGFSDVYYLHTVWNYDPKNDRYRWVAGDVDNQLDDLIVYGDFGIPSASAFPGGALCQTAHTIDKNDNIWFYGSCYDPRLDFWMFNTTSFEFTFYGNYDASDNTTDPSIPQGFSDKGVPCPSCYPGSNQGALLAVDSMNNLWLVGGYGQVEASLSSVYRFNTTSLMWSWEWGAINLGMESVFEGENKYFGGRWAPGGFIDADDRIWVFGGWGSKPKEGEWGDLWSFDTKALSWTVEWGSPESFLAQGAVVSDDFNPGNIPAARAGAQLVNRRDGTLMIVGGLKYNSDVQLNDIWLFNKTSKTWKMVYGDLAGGDIESNYTNYRQVGGQLGSRKYYGSPSGPNTNGHFILYGGGNALTSLNDMWVIPQDPCVTALCDVNAACTSSDIWTFTCTCKAGYTGDGKTCILAPQSAPDAGSTPTPSANNAPVKAPQSKTSLATSLVASVGFVASLVVLFL